MPILNPKRLITPAGQSRLLIGATTEDEPGFLENTSAKLVTDATVDSLTGVVSAYSAAVEGFGAEKGVLDFSDPVLSSSGNRYQASFMMTWTGAGVTGPQVIKGMVIYVTGAPTVPVAYLEFDDPLTVDETGETVNIQVELGYGPNGLYITPRIMPLGD